MIQLMFISWVYIQIYNTMVSYYIISHETILYCFAWKKNVLYSSVLIDIKSYNSEWILDTIWYKIVTYDIIRYYVKLHIDKQYKEKIKFLRFSYNALFR